MKNLIFFITVLPLTSLCQIKNDYSAIMPKGIEARLILDSVDNYIPDSLEQIVFNYIKSQNIDARKCFINKNVFFDAKEETVCIRLEDSDDLKKLRAFEIALKNKQKPAPFSPGFTGTLCVDAKTKNVISFLVDQ